TSALERGRREWFGTACCPANIARLVASLGSYVYGVSEREVWVNLFVAGAAQMKVSGTDMTVQVSTDYPWEGNVKLALHPTKPTRAALRLRIPGWARGTAVAGGLYLFDNSDSSEIQILLNGRPVQHMEEKGYAVIDRVWNDSDVVELTLPMVVRKVVARSEVKADRSRFAL